MAAACPNPAAVTVVTTNTMWAELRGMMNTREKFIADKQDAQRRLGIATVRLYAKAEPSRVLRPLPHAVKDLVILTLHRVIDRVWQVTHRKQTCQLPRDALYELGLHRPDAVGALLSPDEFASAMQLVSVRGLSIDLRTMRVSATIPSSEPSMDPAVSALSAEMPLFATFAKGMLRKFDIKTSGVLPYYVLASSSYLYSDGADTALALYAPSMSAERRAAVLDYMRQNDKLIFEPAAGADKPEVWQKKFGDEWVQLAAQLDIDIPKDPRSIPVTAIVRTNEEKARFAKDQQTPPTAGIVPGTPPAPAPAPAPAATTTTAAGTAPTPAQTTPAPPAHAKARASTPAVTIADPGAPEEEAGSEEGGEEEKPQAAATATATTTEPAKPEGAATTPAAATSAPAAAAATTTTTTATDTAPAAAAEEEEGAGSEEEGAAEEEKPAAAAAAPAKKEVDSSLKDAILKRRVATAGATEAERQAAEDAGEEVAPAAAKMSKSAGKAWHAKMERAQHANSQLIGPKRGHESDEESSSSQRDDSPPRGRRRIIEVGMEKSLKKRIQKDFEVIRGFAIYASEPTDDEVEGPLHFHDPVYGIDPATFQSGDAYANAVLARYITETHAQAPFHIGETEWMRTHNNLGMAWAEYKGDPERKSVPKPKADQALKHYVEKERGNLSALPPEYQRLYNEITFKVDRARGDIYPDPNAPAPLVPPTQPDGGDSQPLGDELLAADQIGARYGKHRVRHRCRRDTHRFCTDFAATYGLDPKLDQDYLVRLMLIRAFAPDEAAMRTLVSHYFDQPNDIVRTMTRPGVSTAYLTPSREPSEWHKFLAYLDAIDEAPRTGLKLGQVDAFNDAVNRTLSVDYAAQAPSVRIKRYLTIYAGSQWPALWEAGGWGPLSDKTRTVITQYRASRPKVSLPALQRIVYIVPRPASL